jgi:hypothetical protein
VLASQEDSISDQDWEISFINESEHIIHYSFIKEESHRWIPSEMEEFDINPYGVTKVTTKKEGGAQYGFSTNKSSNNMRLFLQYNAELCLAYASNFDYSIIYARADWPCSFKQSQSVNLYLDDSSGIPIKIEGSQSQPFKIKRNNN